jgi:hypothetical protein
MTTDLDPDDGMLSRASLAQECLLFRMRQLSEQFHAAYWIEDLEFDVWEMAHQTPHRYGDIAVTENMAKSFRDLSTLAEGWWVYEDKTQANDREEPVFVSLARWQEILEEREAT